MIDRLFDLVGVWERKVEDTFVKQIEGLDCIPIFLSYGLLGLFEAEV